VDKIVAAVMQKNIIFVQADDPLEKVERTFRIRKVTYAAVMDEEGLFYGLITANTIFGILMAAKSISTLKARDICIQKVITVKESTNIRQAAELLIRKNAEHLIVLENDQVLGVLSSMHLLKELLLEIDPAILGVADKKGFFLGLI